MQGGTSLCLKVMLFLALNLQFLSCVRLHNSSHVAFEPLQKLPLGKEGCLNFKLKDELNQFSSTQIINVQIQAASQCDRYQTDLG